MKIRCSSPRLYFFLLGVVLCFATRTQAAFIDLVITEVDDNTLVLSGNDGANWTVSGSGDSWTAMRSAPLANIVPGSVFASWTETDNPLEINTLEMDYVVSRVVTHSPTPGLMMFTVNSDVLATPNDTPAADGTPVSLTFHDANGAAIPHVVQFIDLGDRPAAAPDRVYGALWMAISLAPLLWLKRRLAFGK